MSTHVPTRDEALTLLKEFNHTSSLVKHALAVEGVMRYMARKHGEDEEKWGIIGLVHDLDYERYPEQHCNKTKEILTERGWPEDYIHAIMSHGWGLVTDIKPEDEMEKVLYAIDELTGLIVATALVRPSKSVLDMKVKSLKKKWKDKSFAAGVNREVIQNGAQMLGLELDDLFSDTIMAMREVAEAIDLKGAA